MIFFFFQLIYYFYMGYLNERGTREITWQVHTWLITQFTLNLWFLCSRCVLKGLIIRNLDQPAKCYKMVNRYDIVRCLFYIADFGLTIWLGAFHINEEFAEGRESLFQMILFLMYIQLCWWACLMPLWIMCDLGGLCLCYY